MRTAGIGKQTALEIVRQHRTRAPGEAPAEKADAQLLDKNTAKSSWVLWAHLIIVPQEKKQVGSPRDGKPEVRIWQPRNSNQG